MPADCAFSSSEPQAAPGADWRLLDTRRDDSAETMEFDRTLFRSLKDAGGPGILRFYTWRFPTVSYGRTQPIDLPSQERLISAGWKVVQRPTGGGRVYHRDDLCFSILWRKDDAAIPWEIMESYRAIHGWIRDALADLGRPTEFHQDRSRGVNYGDKWCFQNAVCADLVEGGKKLVGGAQWRDGAAALHQGSIQWPEAHQRIESFRAAFERRFGARWVR